MGSAIALRSDFTADALRTLAKRSTDSTQTRRLPALSAIYDGASRSEAARIGAVGLQIIRDWVLRALLQKLSDFEMRWFSILVW